MKTVIVSFLIFSGFYYSAYGQDAAQSMVEQATQIVIGPTFGSKFNPKTEAVARITDRKIIRQVLESVVGMKAEKIDHVLLVPHLQVAILNAEGKIIAAFALDRCPGKNSAGSRAVLRSAQVVRKDGKAKIDFKDMFEGFPSKALEAYRFENEAQPKVKGELDAAGQPAIRLESEPEGNQKHQPKSDGRSR